MGYTGGARLFPVFLGGIQHIMSTQSEQPNDGQQTKAPPKRRRKQKRELGTIVRDFLERTGLNEDLEAALADVTRRGIDNFWKNFQVIQDVSHDLPPAPGKVVNDKPDPDDPYTVLGVHRSTPPEIIKAVYKAWAINHHPDKGGDVETFKRINVAYDQIKKELGL